MTSKIWTTSDLHLNHFNILSYTKRPWETVDEMNEALIKNFNDTVGAEDICFILGDFAMGDRKKIPEFLSRLNARIILVRGNHDHKNSLQYFPEVYNEYMLEYKGYKIEMVHNPGHLKYEGDFSLCGHVHSSFRIKTIGDIIPADTTHDHKYKHPEIICPKFLMNVGVDVNDYRPISIDSIIEEYENSL